MYAHLSISYKQTKHRVDMTNDMLIDVVLHLILYQVCTAVYRQAGNSRHGVVKVELIHARARTQPPSRHHVTKKRINDPCL
jgi:hypothetical protein